MGTDDLAPYLCKSVKICGRFSSSCCGSVGKQEDPGTTDRPGVFVCLLCNQRSSLVVTARGSPDCRSSRVNRRILTYGSCLQQPTRTVRIGHGSPPFQLGRRGTC